MRILITGRGTSGSWQIRGEQLGHALGATVRPRAQNVQGFDAVVIVKRAEQHQVDLVHRAGAPLIWDVVDAWPQPEGNHWPEGSCKAWLRQEVRRIRPNAIVAATQAMAADCAEFGVPVLALPHHARPGFTSTPMRPMHVLAYEGGTQYIGGWFTLLEAECHRRGWVFVVNPAVLRDVDALVAVRDQDGYAPRMWKSNVKLANAQATGTPIVCCREAGYLETTRGGVLWADTPSEMRAALDTLSNSVARQQLAAELLTWHPSIHTVATTYANWLKEVVCTTAGNC